MSPPVPTSRLLRYLVVSVLAFGGASGAAHAQCQYEITAVIAAPRCPPPFNNVPPTIGTALTEGPDAAVVGSYYPCGASTAHSAFVWRASTGLVTLPRPAGVGTMEAYDISESGVIVGTYDSAERGFRGFVYDDGQYTELPPLPGGAWSEAFAINDAREVVGYRSIGPDGTVTPFNAFVWSELAGFVDLGVMNEPASAAVDINAAGVAVGWTGNGGSISKGFLWEGGTLSFLGPIPGGFTSKPFAVNDSEVIVGLGRIPMDGFPVGASRAFLWHGGDFVSLGTLPDHLLSAALDVSNDAVQIVGASWHVGGNTGVSDGFIWQDGVMRNLNGLLLPGSGVVIESANGIDDAGRILAFGDLNADTVTFLLTPLDPPLGDINIDCEVGVADLVILLNDFSQADSPADLNGDGVVNVLDLIILLLNFGS